ncbi:MAG: hypothetical protein WCJ72_19655, partial [Chryseobacterium sp.]
MGLKFKYQFGDASITTSHSKKLTNNEDNEPISKKMKINDSKLTTILEYSSIQLPIAPFIDYLDKYANDFVNQCLFNSHGK